MSTLFYGGSPSDGSGAIMLVRCQVLDFHREPVYNGPDYLYTRHVLRVRAVYNREINAYDWFPGGPRAAVNPAALAQQAVPVGSATKDYVPGLVRLAGAGNVGVLPAGIAATVARVQRGMDAPTTDVALKHKLLQPRRQLIWLPNSAAGLVSPSINADGTPASCDAKNGPTPLACDVVQVVGGKSYLVDFAIETYVNDATMYQTTPSVLLSHRWTQYEDIDQDYYITRTTEGVAHFRTDRLAFLGAMADDFRGSLFHPKLPGYKRVHVSVRPNPDGSMLTYTIVDRELALSIIPNGVTRIECFHTVEDSGLQFEASATVAAQGALDVALGLTDPVTAAAAAASLGGTTAAKLAVVATKAAFALVPFLECIVVARVWGNADSFRSNLHDVAVRLVLSRMGMSVNPAARIAAGMRMRLTHDVAGSYVECVGSLKTSLSGTATTLIGPTPLVAIGIAGLLRGLNVPNVRGHFPVGDDDTTPILAVSGGEGDGMQLPASFNTSGTGSRGVTAARLITAALLGQDATPQNPPPTPGALGSLTPP